MSALEIRDAQQRELAATTFDKTVVVTAGAGTGKTTLLTERILNILMRPGKEAAGIGEIVAITFTRKAAGEMRVRVRDALLSFMTWTQEAPGDDVSDPVAGAFRRIVGRGDLSAEEISKRAAAALEELERAPIATMHSFAAQLLREHPAEAGVDPAFSEDDGIAFDQHFEASWRGFLAQELSSDSKRAAAWRPLLAGVGLERMARFARCLADESVDLDALGAQLADEKTAPEDVGWLKKLLREAEGLLEWHQDSANRNAEKTLRACVTTLSFAADGRWRFGPETIGNLGKPPGSPKGWSGEELAELKRLQRVCSDLVAVDAGTIRAAFDLLEPFVRDFRGSFARAGYLSFSALLVRARSLLRDQAALRERLKKRFRHVLVDEFQDTDPLQYEIVYFLAEQPGTAAKDWDFVKLEPGKLFIVGDPKQSIYSFRGADIAAYHRIVEDDLAGRSERLDLTTNFRSRENVIAAVNAAFAELIEAEPPFQPEYKALEAGPGAQAELPAQGAELRVALDHEGSAFGSAADATAGEARALAHWIGTELVGKAEIEGREGPRMARAGDVAILLRKLTDVDEYTDALRAEGLPFVVEGQKSFFVTQEVNDLVNLLAAIVDPADKTALAGVLRSPVGGLTDAELAALAAKGCLGYRSKQKLPDGLSDSEALARFFERLRQLRQKVLGVPPAEAIDLLLAELPVVEGAMAQGGGEQAIGNIAKVRRIAAEHGADGNIGLRELVRLLRQSVRELREEGESPLAEEGQDAVRVLTIYKAKGLEFPVVIVPAMHSGISGRDEDIWVRQDWSSGSAGVRLGEAMTVSGVRAKHFLRQQRRAEGRRVLYVAATRAREKLILSAGASDNKRGGVDSFLSYIEECFELPADKANPGVVTVKTGKDEEGAEVMGYKPWLAPEGKSGSVARSGESASIDLKSVGASLEKREKSYADALARPLTFRPSGAHELQSEEDLPEGAAVRMPLVGRRRAGAMLLGTLAHAVLERLDFKKAKKQLKATIGEVLDEHSVELSEDRGELAAELEKLFGSFLKSEVFSELAGAKVLAKELPCLLPWPNPEWPEHVMAAEGIIDLVCEIDGKLLVVDYKTDNVTAKQAAKHAQQYRLQGDVYLKAVNEATGRKPEAFRLVLLRPCVAVDL